MNNLRAGQTKNTQNLDRHELITKKQLYDDAYDCMEKEEKILQHILLEIEN